jgi:hypothetical protein
LRAQHVMRLLILAAVLLFACLAHANYDATSWTGKWTFNDGSMTLCVDNATKNVQGLFKGTWYVNGKVSDDGNTITGRWWDTQIWYDYPAQVAATRTTKCCTQNTGTMSLTRITTDLFEIRLAYDPDAGIQFYNTGPRVLARFDTAMPTPFSCFAADINTGKDLSGHWASRLGRTNTPHWDICIDGGGNHKGSYEYTFINSYGNNFTAKGYSEGTCYFNNAFCWVDWFEDQAGTKTHGGYILSLGYADAMYGIYDFGTGEIYTRTDTGDDCQRNSNLKYKYYTNGSNKISVLLPFVFVLLALLW